MVTGAFTLTALVMVAAWTVSYVKPVTKEWATEAYGKVVAAMDGGALHLSASKLHEEYLGRSRGLPSKPSRWETAILGLAYSEYISEVELLASGGITPTLASIKAGQYVPSGPPKVKFETGWSLTVPVWIPFVPVIPPCLVLLYRPFRRRRTAGVVCT